MAEINVMLAIEIVGGLAEVTASATGGALPYQFKFCVDGKVRAISNKICLRVEELLNDITVIVTGACGGRGSATLHTQRIELNDTFIVTDDGIPVGNQVNSGGPWEHGIDADGEFWAVNGSTGLNTQPYQSNLVSNPEVTVDDFGTNVIEMFIVLCHEYNFATNLTPAGSDGGNVVVEKNDVASAVLPVSSGVPYDSLLGGDNPLTGTNGFTGQSNGTAVSSLGPVSVQPGDRIRSVLRAGWNTDGVLAASPNWKATCLFLVFNAHPL